MEKIALLVGATVGAVIWFTARGLISSSLLYWAMGLLLALTASLGFAPKRYPPAAGVLRGSGTHMLSLARSRALPLLTRVRALFVLLAVVTVLFNAGFLVAVAVLHASVRAAHAA
jgi:hypothetical protein